MSKIVDQAFRLQASITQLKDRDKRMHFQALLEATEEVALVPLVALQNEIDKEYADLEPLRLK